MATYTEQLALYRAAEAKILGGQEVETGQGVRIKRADLASVLSEIRRLEPLAAREAAGRSGPTISNGAGR